MQSVVRGGIGERELPARVMALNDLDRVRHPFDAVEEAALRWRGAQTEADLGFDPRVDEVLKRHPRAVMGSSYQRAIVNRAPDRLPAAIARPDGPDCAGALWAPR